MKMRSLLVSIVMICLIQTGLHAGISEKVQETILDNGLKVLTVEMHTAPIVYSQIAYKVGSRNEKLGITGISHLTEHMMFKGTPTYPKGVISRLIKKNGGVFNAFTSRNMTGYYEQLPSNKLELALAIESDRMQNCVIDPEEYRLEREVVKEERRMRTEDNPKGILYEELYAIAFKSHPYHSPVIGWMGDINTITRDQVYEYYKTYYTPNNATLVLVGDFDTEYALELVRKYYGNIPRGPEVPKVESSEEPQWTRREVTVKRPDQKTVSMTIAFHVPAMGHPDMAPLNVAAKVLGSGSTSRLHKLLVEEKKYARSVGVRPSRSRDPELFRISVSIMAGKEDKLKEVENLIFQEISKLQEELISDYELKKIRNRLKYNEVTRNQKISAVGSKLARYETYLSWKHIDEWYEQLEKVSKEDVQRVMKTYFHPDRATVATLRPGKGMPVDSLQKGRKKVKQAEMAHSDTEEEIDIAKNFSSKFDYEDLASEIVRPKKIAPRIQQDKLSNGIKLYIIEDHSFPTFSIRGLIETGNIPEEKEKPGICSIFGRMMNRGTEEKDYQELSKIKSFFPISFSFYATNGHINFSGSSLMEHVDTLLAIGKEMMFQPAFEKEDLQLQKNKIITTLKRVEGSTGWKTSRFLFKKVYRDHPYGIFHTPETVASITRKDLVEFHKKYIRPETMSIILLGDFEKDKIVARLDNVFGNWENETPFDKKKFPDVKPTEGKTVKIFSMPEKKQVDIRIGFRWVREGHPDQDELDILNHILGGSSLTARLGVKIRDQQGLAYGINSTTRTRNKGGIWFAKSKTEGENLNKLIGSAFEVIEEIKKEGVTEQEVKDAKAYYLSILPMVVETPEDIAMIVYEIIEDHKPLNDFDTYFDRLLKITKEDVDRVAQKYLNTENYVISVAGPVTEDALNDYK